MRGHDFGTKTNTAYFISQGIPHQTQEKLEWLCSEHGIEPGDFRQAGLRTLLVGSFPMRG
jgi:hypothetical protein